MMISANLFSGVAARNGHVIIGTSTSRKSMLTIAVEMVSIT